MTRLNFGLVHSKPFVPFLKYLSLVSSAHCKSFWYFIADYNAQVQLSLPKDLSPPLLRIASRFQLHLEQIKEINLNQIKSKSLNEDVIEFQSILRAITTRGKSCSVLKKIYTFLTDCSNKRLCPENWKINFGQDGTVSEGTSV